MSFNGQESSSNRYLIPAQHLSHMELPNKLFLCLIDFFLKRSADRAAYYASDSAAVIGLSFHVCWKLKKELYK